MEKRYRSLEELPMVLTVEDLMPILSIGRNTAYELIRSGDDIKSVQGNLGHATAAFTLDVYGHVTDQMKEASADRMNEYILCVLPG